MINKNVNKFWLLTTTILICSSTIVLAAETGTSTAAGTATGGYSPYSTGGYVYGSGSSYISDILSGTQQGGSSMPEGKTRTYTDEQGNQHTVTDYPNGGSSSTVTFSEGNSKTESKIIKDDGTVVETSQTTMGGVTSSETVTKKPDGAVETTTENGYTGEKVTKTESADGATVVTKTEFPDKTVKTETKNIKDGSKVTETVNSDGEKWVTKETVTTKKNGSEVTRSETVRPDGSVWTTVTTKTPEGKILKSVIAKENGKTRLVKNEEENTDGSRYQIWFNEDGSYIEYKTDKYGTLTEEFTDTKGAKFTRVTQKRNKKVNQVKPIAAGGESHIGKFHELADVDVMGTVSEQYQDTLIYGSGPY